MSRQEYILLANTADNHRHRVKLNAKGNGKSTVDGIRPHFHNVREKVVGKKNGHVHRIRKKPIKKLTTKQSKKRVDKLKKEGFEIKEVKTKQGIVVLKRKK